MIIREDAIYGRQSVDRKDSISIESQMVDAKITAVDEEKQKISLSIRALLNDEPAEDEE